ncbi:MAG: squalene/phytoene synthase family protein [Pseudomonadota bacterium]
MSLDPNTIACARTVEKGDPDRFRTAMAAPLTARKALFPLYAFNIEVARAPWVTQEAMIAEMRLQWWRDALEEIASGGGAVRRHEVTSPLAHVLTPQDARRLDESVAIRRWDIYRDPFEDQAHFDAYIDQTAGHLMWTAARILGHNDEPRVRGIAYGAGVAAFLRAIPALEQAGRIPLLDGTAAGIRALAQGALDRMGQGRVGANPALWPAIGARRVLGYALKNPVLVAKGKLPEALTPGRLIWARLTGMG